MSSIGIAFAFTLCLKRLVLAGEHRWLARVHRFVIAVPGKTLDADAACIDQVRCQERTWSSLGSLLLDFAIQRDGHLLSFVVLADNDERVLLGEPMADFRVGLATADSNKVMTLLIQLRAQVRCPWGGGGRTRRADSGRLRGALRERPLVVAAAVRTRPRGRGSPLESR